MGDLVFEGSHPYIGDGIAAGWSGAIDRAQDLLDLAAVFYAGHGSPVGHPASVLRTKSATR